MIVRELSGSLAAVVMPSHPVQGAPGPLDHRLGSSDDG